MTSFEEAIPYRLAQLETWRRDQEQWRRDVDNDRNDLKYLIEANVKLAQTVEGLRKTILGFSLSVTGAAITLALTVLLATGKI